MKCVLACNGTVWIEYILDPDSGRFRRRFRATPLEVIDTHGVGSVERVGLARRFYAVYKAAGDWIFQAGKERWLIGPGTRARFEFVGRSRSRFEISENGETLHATNIYHPIKPLFSRIDPTYDQIDLESDHFLLSVARGLDDDGWLRNAVCKKDRPD